MLTDALEAADWSIYCPLASPASPLCPCNDPLLHPPLIYAASCVAISTHRSLGPLSNFFAHSSSYFPRLPAKLFNFFIRRPERLLATDHLLGMEIVTGLACFGLDEKTFPSCSPCVECTNHLLRLGTSFRRVEICGRIFFSLSLSRLRTIERRIRDNCRSFRPDDLYRNEEFSLIKKFQDFFSKLITRFFF